MTQTMTADALERALEGGDVVVHYQPCYDLRTGAMVAVEALARLRDPDSDELVQPDAFLDVLESTGLVVHLDEMVLGAAAEQVARWRELPGGEGLCLAVNLSTADLDDPYLPQRFREATSAAGLPLDAVIVELTETLLSRGGQGHEQVLAALADLGCNITLDDFGTGNASFDYLRRFEVNGVKIDRSFVQYLGAGGQGERMAESLVRFCLSLGVHVVAEGIERPRHVAALRRLGCPFGQGFLMSRPVDAATLESLLRASVVPPSLAPAADVSVLSVLPIVDPGAKPVAGATERRTTRGLAVLLIGVLALIAALATSGRADSQDTLVAAAQARLEAIDSLAAHAVDVRLGGLRDAVTAYSHGTIAREALASPTAPALDAALDVFDASASGIHNTSLYDVRGTMLAVSPAQTEPAVVGRNFAFRDWFGPARSAVGAVVTQAYRLMTADHMWAIAFVAPVRSDEGRLLGFAMATLSVADLQAEMGAVLDEHAVDVIVVDDDGTVLADTDGEIGRSVDDPRLLDGVGEQGAEQQDDLWAVGPVDAVGGWLLVEQDRHAAIGHSHGIADDLLWLVVFVAVVLVLIGLASDARRRRLKSDLSRSNAWLVSILDATPAAILISDGEDRIHDANAAAADLLGVPSASLRGQTLTSWLSIRDRPIAGCDAVPATVVTASGDVRRVEVRVRDAAGPAGETLRLHSLVDVTPHREEQERLHVLGRTDPLTGAANRVAVDEAVRAAAAPASPPHALLMLDLDGFKAVNDEYGHAAGDSVLRSVADVLVAAVSPADTVARVGGDEFIVVVRLDDAATHDGMAAALELRVQEALDAHPFTVDVPVGVSIGSLLVNVRGGDVEALLRDVDQRMYASKRQRAQRSQRVPRRDAVGGEH